MLMPVQLPDHFVIAGAGEVEIRNAAKVVEARFLGVNVIAPPGDLRAHFDHLPEDWEAMSADLFGQTYDLFSESRAAEARSHFGRIGQGFNRRSLVASNGWLPPQQPEIPGLLREAESNLRRASHSSSE